MQTHTRVYDNYAQAEKVVRDLENAGIPSADISMLANKHVSEQYDMEPASATASGAGIGAAVGGGAGLLAGLGMMAIPGIGPVVAAGWLAATAAGALAGGAAGGLLGALVDMGTTEADAQVYSEAVRRGGTLVTVRSVKPAATVVAILDRYLPIDPAVRRREFETAGWRTFDPAAEQYTPTQAEIERIRRTDG
jgi:hypothetical protein